MKCYYVSLEAHDEIEVQAENDTDARDTALAIAKQWVPRWEVVHTEFEEITDDE